MAGGPAGLGSAVSGWAILGHLPHSPGWRERGRSSVGRLSSVTILGIITLPARLLPGKIGGILTFYL